MKKNILTFAYNLEKEAAALYESMSHQVKDTFVAQVFRDLAQEEEKHAEQLQQCLARHTLLKIPEFPELNLFDTLDKPATLSPDMSLEEIMAYVIKMEEEAIILYGALENASLLPEDREMYQNLKKMECAHKYRFERVLQDIDQWRKK